jgi:ankyrin repeat protein
MSKELFDAIRSGHVDIVKNLFSDNHGKMSLRIASECGHTDIILWLLSLREPDGRSVIDVNYMYNGRTILMYAASHGHIETVRILIEADVDVNVKRQSYTALYYACTSSKDNHEIVSMLLNAGADTKIERSDLHRADGLKVYESVLVSAVNNNNENIVRVLLNFGLDPNTCKYYTSVLYIYGESVLSTAAFRGNLKIVNMLLEFGANARYEDDDMCPLRYACMSHSKSSQKIVEILLEAGADHQNVFKNTRHLNPKLVRIVRMYAHRFLKTIVVKDMFETVCQFI